jgi:hypothetical protein
MIFLDQHHPRSHFPPTSYSYAYVPESSCLPVEPFENISSPHGARRYPYRGFLSLEL